MQQPENNIELSAVPSTNESKVETKNESPVTPGTIVAVEDKSSNVVEAKGISENDGAEVEMHEINKDGAYVQTQPGEMDPSYIGTQMDGASFSSSVINMTNTIIGAGTLSLPSTILDGGIIGALILLVLSLVFSLVGAHYLAAASIYTKEDSYGFIGRKLTGKNWGYVADLFMIVFDFGIAIGYCNIVFGQTVDLISNIPAFTADQVNNAKWWIAIIETLVLMFPILCVPTVDALKWTSSICVVCIIFFVLISIILGISQVTSPTNTLTYYWLPRDPVSFLTAISVFFTCFCSHVNIPKMTSELKLPEHTKFANKLKKMDRVDNLSFILCAFVYYIVGVCGYLAFGDSSAAGNLLDNFQELLANPDEGTIKFGSTLILNVLLIIVKLSYLFIALFSFPVLSFSPLVSIDKTFFKQPRPVKRRVIEAFIWCVGCYIIAMLIPSLRVIFSLTGAMCGMVLVFVWPSVYFICISKREKAKEHSKQVRMFKTSDYSVYLAWFLVVLGIIGAIVLTSLEVKNMIDSDDVETTVEPTMVKAVLSSVASLF